MNTDIRPLMEARKSFIVASNGQFLGKLSLNQYDSLSISNTFGSFGSIYSSTSIFNKYSTYGSQYSSLSPFNLYTSTPPSIYLNGNFWGWLTKNVYKPGNKVDPDYLLGFMQQNNLIY